MKLDCVIIGYYDEPFTSILSRIEPYKATSGGYKHMLAHSANINGKRLKFSEIMSECISHSTGIKSDLTNFRMPSLGVHYIRQFLSKKGLNVDFINFFNYGKEKLEYLLKHDPPNCIAISTTSVYEPEPMRYLIDFIRDINPDPTIVIGGSYISSLNFELTEEQQNYKYQFIGADVYVNELQGEETLSRLCYELRNPVPDLYNVPNLIFFEDGNFVRTQVEKENNILDDDPVVEFTFYKDHPLPPVYLRTARSCPEKCAFCRYPILGGEHVFANLDSVKKNLDYIHSLGVKSIVFIDDTINRPLDRFKDLCRLLINGNYNFKWFSFFRCSDADEEAFDLMKESGCQGVFLGIENGTVTMLKNMNKHADINSFKWAIGEMNKRGIWSMASFMIGFPGENEYTVKKTIEFIEEVKPTFFDIQTWFYEKAVPISKESDYYGLIGHGYGWQHNTMKWDRAADLTIESVRNIKNSIPLPTFSFNLWTLAYYLTQGITFEDFKRFSKLYQKLTGIDDHEIDDEYRMYEKQILSVFKDNEVLKNNLKLRAGKEYKNESIKIQQEINA